MRPMGCSLALWALQPFSFAATVAEHFHHKTHEPTPLGSDRLGAGIKLFAARLRAPTGDIPSFDDRERQKCSKQGRL
jgi:hypothetical protein